MRGALATSNQSTMKGVNSIPLANIGISDANQYRHGDPPVDLAMDIKVRLFLASVTRGRLICITVTATNASIRAHGDQNLHSGHD